MGFGPALYAQRRYAQSNYSESPYVVALAETLTGSDALTLQLQKAFADSISNSDIFGALISLILSDSLSAPTDAYLISMTSVLADSLTSGDSLIAAIASLFAESIASSDGTAIGIIRALSETMAGATDALGASALVGFSEMPWALPPGTTITPHKYGALLYGQPMYSTDQPFPRIFDTLSAIIATALVDTLTSSDALAVSAFRSLVESLESSDIFAEAADTVGLSEFILIKEFISIRLKRASAWTEGGKPRGITPHFYGNVLYGQNKYSTNIAILWQAVQSDLATTWRAGQAKSRTVTPHIYGNVLYSKNMYSTNIAILWKAIQKSSGPGFTNDDGHKYNN